MNWEVVAALAEIIAAIGVIVSLIYVGQQLKQSNLTARSMTRQEINSSINTWAMSIAASPTLAEAIAKVNSQGLLRDDATDVEKVEIGYALFALVNQQHYIYRQWQDGLIGDQEFEGLFGPSTPILTKPYMRSLWPIVRASFPTEFAAWYENRYQLVEDS